MEHPIYEFVINPDSEHFTTAIVKDPAVESTLMYFNNETDKPIFFANEEKRVIYAVAMRPNKLIFRKETDTIPAHYGFFSAESIEKFQENYAKHQGDNRVNVNHTETPIEGVFKIENWIVKDKEIDKSKALGLDAEVGDLIQGFKIENDEVWEQCKNGNLDGLSIEASLSRKLVSNFKTEIEMSTEKNPETFWNFCKTFFSGDTAAKVEETDEEKAARLEAEKMAEDTPPPADETPNELEAENELLKQKVAELEATIATLEADKVKEATTLETMQKEILAVKEEFSKFKSETPLAQAIVNAPKEVVKSYDEMSNYEKLKFNKENGFR